VIHVSSDWVGKVDSFSRIPVPKMAAAFTKSKVGRKLSEIADARAAKIAEETGCSEDEAEDQVHDSKEFNTMFNNAYRFWKIGSEFVMHDDTDEAARSRLALAYLEKRVAHLEKHVAEAAKEETDEAAKEDDSDEELSVEKPPEKAQDKDDSDDSSPDSDEDDAAPVVAAAPGTTKKAKKAKK